MMSEQELQGITNYVRLSEQVGTAGQPTREQLAAVARAGYQVVVNLATLDSEEAVPDERDIVEALGLEYVHIPVVWERPTRADLEKFLQAMDGYKDRRVFVHCIANMRVSVFMALYRVLRLGWSLEEALDDVHQLWVPDETWQRFMDDMLRELANGGEG